MDNSFFCAFNTRIYGQMKYRAEGTKVVGIYLYITRFSSMLLFPVGLGSNLHFGDKKVQSV